ncbi:hypothetical protein GN958_ATG08466 [Phytophthora infestans]|uniref:Uncharacterized protein n=1 Tax=Phytophthora infestans TaxID=4787 RepID=A0A8S9UNM1_PHYIN|nr:hypothetical protein GN958_ATG08466 [Phytophthora infestans]
MGELLQQLAAGCRQRAKDVGVNTTRKEAEDQPKTGWQSNLRTQTCPCSYHPKYGNRVHRPFAMQVLDRDSSNDKEPLANHRAQKRKRATVDTAPTAAGRPSRAGHPPPPTEIT